MHYRLGYEKCPFGFTASEQIIYLEGLTTLFYPHKNVIENANATNNTNLIENPFSKYSSLLTPSNRANLHIYLLPHTIMKYSTGILFICLFACLFAYCLLTLLIFAFY